MSNKADAVKHLNDSIKLARSLAAKHPNQAPWATLISMLEKYEAKVVDHWPLTDAEKEECKIGWFSVKNIEEPFPHLHTIINEAAHDIRHSGE